MAQRETAALASSELKSGEKLYLKRARRAFPFLVSLAKAGKTIYYSDLAKILEMPNPRNLNFVLGAIGSALQEMGERKDTKIPAIQSLVVNKQYNLPGEGFGYFISEQDFKIKSKSQQRQIVHAYLTEVFTYSHWDQVLGELGLEPVPFDFSILREKVKKSRGGGGEGPKHKALKEYIAFNPQVVGLPASLRPGQMEYPLLSGDAIDVLFENKGELIGIEVKSEISDEGDIIRGLFQCVKYKTTLEAQQAVNSKSINSSTILAIGGVFPQSQNFTKYVLGVKVVDQIKIPS